jgi:hypothetical protein
VGPGEAGLDLSMEFVIFCHVILGHEDGSELCWVYVQQQKGKGRAGYVRDCSLYSPMDVESVLYRIIDMT